MIRAAMFGFVVCFGMPASAEPLRIERMGVAYWSETDTVEMRVQFDRVPSFPADYFSLALIADRPISQSEWVSFGEGGIAETLQVFHHRVIFPNQVDTFKGEFPYSIDGTTWSATIPFNVTGLVEIPPTFNLTVHGANEPPNTSWSLQQTPIQIDQLIMAAPVPEPTTFVLAGCAAITILGSRRWLRRNR